MKFQVTEKKILQAIEMMSQVSDDPPVGFIEALDMGREFKAANLHPFYVFDDVLNTFIVTSEEHVENRGN